MAINKPKLLQKSTSDGLYLHGYYLPSENKEVAVLHIHGFEGNFYENNFVHVLADKLEKANIGFLTVNTRGNGKLTEFNTTDGKHRCIGARYELLEEAHLDISSWLEVLIEEKYREIVLMGHSLGTLKVVRYLFEGKLRNKINKLILLAPFDKNGLMASIGRNDIKNLLRKAKKKIDSGMGDDLITEEFESIVMSYKTFVSWYKQDDLGRIFEFCSPNYNFPILNKIDIPTKIVVGSKDEYFHQSNPNHPEEAMSLLLKNISNSVGIIIENAVHSFAPYEELMADEVVAFAKH